MNAKSMKLFFALAVVLVIVATFAEAHKKFFSQPNYHHDNDRCICDCGHQQPILPNKPYYGSGGYHQPPPHRPSGGGYGNAGSYAVAGSYGSGGGQASGGY